MGLIYDPNQDEIFTAFQGNGAYLNRTKKLRIRHPNRMGEVLLGTSCSPVSADGKDKALQALEKLKHQIAAFRRMGSASLDLAYLASGRLDAVWQWGLKPWDIAAGLLIVQEAGGLISDHRGEQDMLSSGHVLASSPGMHGQLLACLRSSQLPVDI